MSRALPANLDCIVAVEQVTDYLEGALTPECHLEFEQHLVVCPGCVAYLRQIRAQVGATPALGGATPPSEQITHKLLQMFRAGRRGEP